MNSLKAFIKKEAIEVWKNYQFLLVTAIFAMIGLISVFAAKFTPDIISQLVSEELGAILPKPLVSDIWLQFNKNITQLGLVAFVIIVSGSLTNEYQKGTLIILVTKGLERWTVVTSKIIVSLLVFTSAYAISGSLTYLYGLFYFNGEKSPNLWLYLSLLWLFGVFLIFLIYFASVIVQRNYSVLLLVGLVFCLLVLANLPENWQTYNPLRLASRSQLLVTGEAKASEFTKVIFVTLFCNVSLFTSSLWLFNKKSL